MLDFGWAELLLILVLIVLVTGPDDIPNVMHALGRMMRRLQYVRHAVSGYFDQFMEASDIEELRRNVNFEAPKPDEKETDEKSADALDKTEKTGEDRGGA